MPARAQVFRAVAEDASFARDSTFIFRIIFPGELTAISLMPLTFI
jgi:hypothetical protein